MFVVFDESTVTKKKHLDAGWSPMRVRHIIFLVSEEGSLFGQCEGCSWPGAQWVALRFMSISASPARSCDLRDLQFEVKTQVLSVGPWLWAAVRLAWAFVVWQASCDQEAVVEISMWLGRDWFEE